MRYIWDACQFEAQMVFKVSVNEHVWIQLPIGRISIIDFNWRLTHIFIMSGRISVYSTPFTVHTRYSVRSTYTNINRYAKADKCSPTEAVAPNARKWTHIFRNKQAHSHRHKIFNTYDAILSVIMISIVQIKIPNKSNSFASDIIGHIVKMTGQTFNRTNEEY